MAAEANDADGGHAAMKWVKRGLWVAAWGCWLWLGFGLYRELPRDLGPVVASIPMTNQQVAGFVGEANLVALVTGRVSPTVELFDCETGQRKQTLDTGLSRLPSEDLYRWLARSLLFADGIRDSIDYKPALGLHCIDVAAGTINRLSAFGAVACVPHDNRPWVLVAERHPDSPFVRRIVVFDRNTGMEVFVREPEPYKRSLYPWAFFIPGSDRLVVPMYIETGAKPTLGLEVWKIGSPSKMEKFLPEVPLPSPRVRAVTPNGRFLVVVPDLGYVAGVYDLNEARIVFAEPPAEMGGNEPLLSPSGRTLLAGTPGTLWSLDSDRAIWRPGPDSTLSPDFVPGRFLHVENWSSSWKDWFPAFKYTSTAFRDLESGEVIVRLSGFVGARFQNPARTLEVDTSGEVRRLPYPVNWTLFSICQAILALPLVILWAALGWRRKRRLRMASVQP
jgi:hypothetical protein